jgi:hypothetical protein
VVLIKSVDITYDRAAEEGNKTLQDLLESGKPPGLKAISDPLANKLTTYMAISMS